jgi:hypothetical protein
VAVEARVKGGADVVTVGAGARGAGGGGGAGGAVACGAGSSSLSDSVSVLSGSAMRKRLASGVASDVSKARLDERGPVDCEWSV